MSREHARSVGLGTGWTHFERRVAVVASAHGHQVLTARHHALTRRRRIARGKERRRDGGRGDERQVEVLHGGSPLTTLLRNASSRPEHRRGRGEIWGFEDLGIWGFGDL